MDKEKLIEHFKQDRFSELLGMEILEAEPGHAAVRMKISPDHLNAVGGLHGGVTFSLADYAFAIASNSHETLALGINTHMMFLKALGEGSIITATADETSINPKLATYDVTVTDENGDVVALFQGMVYRKKDSIYDKTYRKA